MALITGWTMNEVMGHEWPDLYELVALMAERATEGEQRRAMAEMRAAVARRRAGRRR